MKTVRLTTAQAIVRFLTAQRTLIDGEERPLVAGVFGIFGHGNVTCLGEALHDARGVLPDLPRPERAGDGAGGDRLRQGDAAAAVHGGDLVGRPRRDEHGHGGRGRARQPAAAAAAVRRHVPFAHPRPGAAAGRALRRSPRSRSTTPSGRSRATGIASRTRRRWRSRCRSRSPRWSIRPTAARPSSACRRTCRPRPTTTRCGCSSPSCTSCAGCAPTTASWQPPPTRCAAPRRR